MSNDLFHRFMAPAIGALSTVDTEDAETLKRLVLYSELRALGGDTELFEVHNATSEELRLIVKSLKRAIADYENQTRID